MNLKITTPIKGRISFLPIFIELNICCVFNLDNQTVVHNNIKIVIDLSDINVKRVRDFHANMNNNDASFRNSLFENEAKCQNDKISKIW
jgi:hypothetical protein